MGDLGSEHEAALELVIDEFNKLKELDPKHDLLKFSDVVYENGFNQSSEYWTEFNGTFNPDPKSAKLPVASMLAKYYVALRDAANQGKTPSQ